MTLETVDAGASAPASTPAVSADTPAVVTADTGAAPAAQAAVEPAKPSIDQDLKAVWEKLHPPRDKGRFAPRDGKPAAEAPITDTAAAEGAAPETTTSTDQPAEGGVETAQPAASSIEPPHSWSAEDKAAWAAVPPAAQAIVARREAEAHKAITRAGEQIKAFEPVSKVLDQFREVFDRNQLQPHDGIARMMAMEQYLGSDPANAVMEIARAYNVDLQRLIGTQPSAATSEAQPGTQDPLVSTLQTQLGTALKEINQIKSHLTAQQRERLAAEKVRSDETNAGLARQIADFSKDKPHFETVRVTMGKLMEADESLSLDDAYERATYAVPDIRKRILADQRKTEEDTKAKVRAAQVADAKKAGSVNVKSTPAAGQTPRTMDDTLREVASRHYG